VIAMTASLRLSGRSVIVTGGGSGIGAALCAAFVREGARVYVADLDEAAAIATVRAATGPGTALPVRLDVTDAAAVQDLVDRVVGEHGSLDVIVNNAGIGVGGDTESLTLAEWNRTLDVNVRGVIHGVAAAYPVMVRQGHGHIVNTASLAGLLPAGLLTVYATTKHAVVGLSTSLRAEAAIKGVKVLAVCPAAVETPLLDAPGAGGFDVRRYVTVNQGVKHAITPTRLAAEVLDAMSKNKALLVTPRTARISWRVSRLSPSLAQVAVRRIIAAQRKDMSTTSR
jgi:NAD(P)-dependent dehydrogenase (short-subunit alcohol dehydrogenase family)